MLTCVIEMKAKFVNYQGDKEKLLFEHELDTLPRKGEGYWFYFLVEGHETKTQHYASVAQITYCTDIDNNFSHVEIELGSF